MDRKSRFLVFLLLVGVTQFVHGGWSGGVRSKCGIFKRYRAEAHAGYKFIPIGSSLTVNRDSGCTYAHAGPLRRYLNNVLLAQSEGYFSSSIWGYAQSWNTGNVIGIAGEPEQTQAVESRAAATNDCPIPSSSNQFFATAVTFTDAGRLGKRITIEKVTASFAASIGYSVLEIAATAKDKTLWRGRAVVHEGRLATDGQLAASLFTASTPTARAPDVLYTIGNKDIAISLPATVSLDDVEVTLRGDAGDESVLNPPSFPAPVTITDLNMQGGNEKTLCPPLGVELSRDDAPAIPYLDIMLPNLDQRCATRGAGLKLDTITFTKCAKDPRGAGFGPNATATFTCVK